MTGSHGRVYGAAALYDLAFSYRDCAAEARFLRQMFEVARGRRAGSFLELAAGPARHAIEMLAEGVEAAALDMAPEMAAYARGVAAARGLELEYLTADMRGFASPTKFELAACMLCSAGYLLTDDAVISHLEAVRAALVADGMYVLELTHPSELLGPRRSAATWTTRDAGGTLDVAWRGDPSTARDGVWESRVSLVYRPFDGATPICVEDTARQRGFTHDGFTRLAEQSGFVVELTMGALDANVPLEDPHASRMVIALRPG